MSMFSLGYFNRLGKVELIRLIFAAGDTNYRSLFVDNVTDSDSRYGNVPYLEVDGFQIPLISVIARFLARHFDLTGITNLETAQMDALAQTVMLVIDKYFEQVFSCGDDDERRVAMKYFMDYTVENNVMLLEKLLKDYNPLIEYSSFSLGNKLTYADLFIFELATNYLPMDNPSFRERFPNVFRIRDTVSRVPVINEYLEQSETSFNFYLSEQ